MLGAGKAGTTSLAALLRAHPGVFLPDLDEPGWLAWDPAAPRRWPADVPADVPVRSREAWLALYADAPEGVLLGDVSPQCLESSIAPERIARELPDAPLIVTLRDPADRAWSGYWMHRLAGWEKRPPEQAFGPQEHRVQAGYYARNLQPFGDDVLVLLLEEWSTDPGALLPLAQRLGLDPAGFPAQIPRSNRGGQASDPVAATLLASPTARALGRRLPRPVAAVARSLKARALKPPPPMPPELRRRLDGLYRDDVLALSERLGRRLPGWLRSLDGPT